MSRSRRIKTEKNPLRSAKSARSAFYLCGFIQVDPFEARPLLWNNESVNNKISPETNQPTSGETNGPNATPEPVRVVDNPLSEREMDVARLLATGASNNEIAEQLVISPHTVKVHLRNIYEKLGVSTRTEASLQLLQQGWMVLPGVEIPGNQIASESTIEVAYPEPTTLVDGGETVFAWQPLYLVAALALVILLLVMPGWFQSSEAKRVDLLSDADNTMLGQPSINIMPRWTSQAPLPEARSRLALAFTANSQIYAIGGENNNGVAVDMVNIYDLARNEWRDGPALPFPLANLAAAVVAGQIFVAGGTTPAQSETVNDTASTISATLLQYSVEDTEWTVAGDLPAPLAGASLVATPDALYLLGGWDGEQMHSEVWRLDLPIEEKVTAADWRMVSQMKTAHAFGGAVAVGDYLYVAGGYDGQRELDVVQRYNLIEEGWELLPSLATPRGGIQLLNDGLAIFAVGGGWGQSVGTLERFDPVTGLWSHFPSPIAGEWRNLGAAASPDGYLYLVGGWADSYINVHLHYQSSFRSFLPATQGNDSGGR